MEMRFTKQDNDIRLIQLIGKLDSTGSSEIETKFTGYCAGDKVRVIVDFARVDFLASMGIRLLMSAAQSVSRRGGKMVIVNPIPDVQHVLEAAGIPAVIPVYSYLESAETVLMAS
ncbi:MAG TPA: STAS domain-containing protein [Anaerolineales bacterium]|nr:STAS domain-containing protein [Anaerolineales bacterium]